MRLVKWYAQNSLVLKKGERFLITGKDIPPRIQHNGLVDRRWKNPGYFIIMNGSEECTICVTPGIDNYVSYSAENKAKLCKVTKMEEVKLPKKSFFSKHGNAQNAGGGLEGNHALRYSLNLIPEYVDLEDVVAFANRNSTQLERQNEFEVLLGDVYSLYTSDQKKRAEDNVSIYSLLRR